MKQGILYRIAYRPVKTPYGIRPPMAYSGGLADISQPDFEQVHTLRPIMVQSGLYMFGL